MTLKGIDISGWQPDIDASKVDGDFVIVKSTEGTGYVSPTFAKQMQDAELGGKLLGVYHYINGNGADGEMNHFFNIIKSWIGKAIICLDWESIGNKAWQNEAYLEQCIKKIKALTGKNVIVYSSASVFPWELCRKYGCSTWVAQYANMNPTGWQDNPWNEGKYSCLIRQYSSEGFIAGYGKRLDINKAYCSKADWLALAGGKASNPTTNTSTPSNASNANNKKKRRKKMECIYRPNGENYLVYYDGCTIHPLSHPDEVTAIQKVYKACYGTDIPMFELGTKKAPWATRFANAVNRK